MDFWRHTKKSKQKTNLFVTLKTKNKPDGNKWNYKNYRNKLNHIIENAKVVYLMSVEMLSL